jgi:glycosyltransferase involved in cell wall biosynthesis
MAEPIVSIITIAFNENKSIGATIDSVLCQTYTNIEYIVVDGGSNDGTVEIIKANSNRIHKFISEKDKGIYDAMNKGLKMATGDYVYFLNAGDLLFDEQSIQKIMHSASNADVYYGDTRVINAQGEIIGRRHLSPPEKLDWRSFRWGMSVSHQSILIKRSLCSEFDLSFQISADIDWVIKALKQSKSIVNVHFPISKFLEGGVSSVRLKRAWKERFHIMVRHYGWITAAYCHVIIAFRFLFQKLIGRK